MDRRTLLVALVAAEIAIVALAVQAVRGAGVIPTWSSPIPVETSLVAAAPPEADVSISLPGAAITLAPSHDGQIHLQESQAKAGWWWGGDPKERKIHLDHETAGTVRIWRPGLIAIGYKVGTDTVRIELPSPASIDVAQCESIAAEGFRSQMSLRSTEGPVTVRDQRGNVSVSNKNGRIVLEDIEANAISVNTKNGRVVGGNVTLEGSAPRLDVNSHNGRVELALKQVSPDGRYMIHTDNGRIRLRLPQQSDVTVSLHTRHGEISATGVTLSGEGNDRRAVFGNGTASFDVSTRNGPIDLAGISE
jgi:hypothetical protein